jgi:hypothetical protein
MPPEIEDYINSKFQQKLNKLKATNFVEVRNTNLLYISFELTSSKEVLRIPGDHVYFFMEHVYSIVSTTRLFLYDLLFLPGEDATSSVFFKLLPKNC